MSIDFYNQHIYTARKECEKLIDKARNEIVERINNS